jgi:hypothetical protein
MADSPPAGFVPIADVIRQRGEDAVRRDLYHRRLHAIRYSRRLEAVEAMSAADLAVTSLRDGYAIGPDLQRWEVLVWEPAAAQTTTAPTPVAARGKIEPPTPELDMPELLQLQMRALEHFKGQQPWPKKEELAQWLLEQARADGIPMSSRLAETMATACRPVAAMRGGNKR